MILPNPGHPPPLWAPPSPAYKSAYFLPNLFAVCQILQQSVDAILERGEKLEDLVMHSNKLSMQTKMMYKSVQKKPGWLEECLGCSPV